MKTCYFCRKNIKDIDYKDTDTLSIFIDDLGKIKPPRKTGACAKHQRKVAKAIKRARAMGLMPFTTR
ncbi:MAG: 30S ribosomal protein S18 [Candidatus Portnoybacteria bacterium]|nr:30S ribosomal protein S18 [Candidatus Portnoybacteria bacterium]